MRALQLTTENVELRVKVSVIAVTVAMGVGGVRRRCWKRSIDACGGDRECSSNRRLHAIVHGVRRASLKFPLPSFLNEAHNIISILQIHEVNGDILFLHEPVESSQVQEAQPEYLPLGIPS